MALYTGYRYYTSEHSKFLIATINSGTCLETIVSIEHNIKLIVPTNASKLYGVPIKHVAYASSTTISIANLKHAQETIGNKTCSLVR